MGFCHQGCPRRCSSSTAPHGKYLGDAGRCFRFLRLTFPVPGHLHQNKELSSACRLICILQGMKLQSKLTLSCSQVLFLPGLVCSCEVPWERVTRNVADRACSIVVPAAAPQSIAWRLACTQAPRSLPLSDASCQDICGKALDPTP